MDPALLKWCRRLIATPSIGNVGTRRIAQLCASELLSPAGITPRIIPSRELGSEQVNLVATVAGTAADAPPILLNTHLDTVPPGDNEAWTACDGMPMRAAIAGDRIYGLGAADTKLDFAAKAFALIAAGRVRRTIHLAATFGEERGLLGAHELATANIFEHGTLAFIGEPSNLELVTANKGLMAYRLRLHCRRPGPNRSGTATRFVFEGRAAHSSTPALGRNAIAIALAALARAPRLRVASLIGGDAVNKVPARCEVVAAGICPSALANAARVEPIENTPSNIFPAEAIRFFARFAQALRAFTDRVSPVVADYSHPSVTSNFGIINSDRDTITAQFEMRPPAEMNLNELHGSLAEIIARLSPRPDSGLTSDLSRIRANPGFRAALDGETVASAASAMARAGLTLNTAVKAGCTEAGVYAAAGLRPVVIGPGPSVGVIHAPNEYNLLSQVEAARRFYSELIRD